MGPGDRSPALMGRRAFLGASVLGLLAAPASARTPQAARIARVVVLASATPLREYMAAFQAGLRDHGWVEGQNIRLDLRSADGHDGRLGALAAQIANLDIDLVVALHTPAAVAAKRALGRIPIVAVSVVDPVAVRLVPSLARPGGNVTGNTVHGPGIAAKTVEALAEILPKGARVVALGDEGSLGWTLYWEEAEAVAYARGLELRLLNVRRQDELDGAFARLGAERPQGLYVVGTSFIAANRQRVLDFVGRHRLPAIYSSRSFVEQGGLMSYSANVGALYRRAGYFVDRILRGTRPADLPIEQPTKFELAVNLRTARAQGVAIPPALLQRADRVIG